MEQQGRASVTGVERGFKEARGREPINSSLLVMAPGPKDWKTEAECCSSCCEVCTDVKSGPRWDGEEDGVSDTVNGRKEPEKHHLET